MDSFLLLGEKVIAKGNDLKLTLSNNNSKLEFNISPVALPRTVLGLIALPSAPNALPATTAAN